MGAPFLIQEVTFWVAAAPSVSTLGVHSVITLIVASRFYGVYERYFRGLESICIRNKGPVLVMEQHVATLLQSRHKCVYQENFSLTMLNRMKDLPFQRITTTSRGSLILVSTAPRVSTRSVWPALPARSDLGWSRQQRSCRTSFHSVWT